MTRLATEALIIDIPGRSSGVPLNLAIEPGQVWGVLGPNGVGKTTLLHTLAGLREPRSGKLLLDGTPLDGIRRKTVSQRMGLVFQDRQDGFPATALETRESPKKKRGGASTRVSRWPPRRNKTRMRRGACSTRASKCRGSAVGARGPARM